MNAVPALAPLALQAAPLYPEDLVAPESAPAVPGGPPFAALVQQGIAAVNEKLQAGEAGLQRLAEGDFRNLHQVMVALEESRLSFQLLMQVRSRLLEAYQDVMKMQI